MHRTNNTELVKLVAVERCSASCTEAFACPDRVSEVVAVMQGEGDTPADLADATALRLKQLEGAGSRVVTGAVMVGPRQDRPARAARWRIGREVLSRLAHEGEFALHAVGAREDRLALAERLGAAGATGATDAPAPARALFGGGLREASEPGVSTGNTEFCMFSNSSASELAIGFVGGSRGPQEAGYG